ncbi:MULTISPECIES: taurine catabolism dioxygenase TauD [Streptomyces]|uniref:taurine catabolism dioxygenase TauD n=1 Tax=Streptomyces lycopersici TaxID=2974589 RepID=UPI0021CEF2F5|nr:taurine catabolism dioxygenase TauD [Streptomyces sp. NEAU-383]
MQPFHTLSETERRRLHSVLASVTKNPYEEYGPFARTVRDLVDRDEVPAFFREVCAAIRRERTAGTAQAHVLRNCPLDEEIPVLDLDDPVADKYRKKRTFIGETFLELFGLLMGTPLLSYATRFNGDFFIDVIAINRYSGMQTGFSDSELVFHNERTAHAVRADYISLLGMRCPEGDYIYTGFVDGRDLLAELGEEEQRTLRRPYFYTPFDVLSRDNNGDLTVSGAHAILENHHSFRYLDTCTTVLPGAPTEAKDALLSLKDALVKADKQRHRILRGDLFSFANQDGLHSRDKMEINDPERARQRWLLKTYAFRDRAAADVHRDRWIGGVPGMVGD